MRKSVAVFLVLLVIAVFVAACTVSPTPIPSTAVPTAVAPTIAPQPTNVPKSTETAQPTETTKPTTAPTLTEVPKPTETPKPTAVPTATVPPPLLTNGEGCTSSATKVTWFVGPVAGTLVDDVTKERAWVDKFNKSQTELCVILNVVYSTGSNSYDALRVAMAGSNPPDIVGPIGKDGRANFQGAWADILPLAKDAGFDQSAYDPALLEFTKDEGVQVGIPFALYPSFIYYNKSLFDQAKLPYPPHKVGEKYNGKDWNLDTFTELAQKLTIDSKGNDATNKAFDAKNVKQFGFFEPWEDGRGIAAFFSGGLPYDEKDPTKAVIPDAWKQAYKWYYDGVWKNNFMPNTDYQNSDLLGKGNALGAGNVAMVWSHSWYVCCFDLSKTRWDIAVVPTINGKTTAKLNGETFVISKQSKNQKAAFKVLSKMIADKDLYAIYGGMPAKVEDRPAFFAALDAKVTPNKIDWAVAQEMVKYPDLPNHQSWLPNLAKANDLFTAWRTKLDQTPGLDMDKEIAKLQSDLDAAFKAAK